MIYVKVNIDIYFLELGSLQNLSNLLPESN